MKPCLKHILSLPEEFQDKLVKKVETLIRIGVAQQDANQAALSALIEEAIDEMEAIESALREQHPDLFIQTDAMRAANEPATAPPAADDQATTPELRHSRGQHTLPDFGTLAQAQEALQDRYNRWKQTIEAVRGQGGTVNEVNDFYATEERFWGKVGAQNEAFGKEIQRFVRDVHADGLELDDVALYAYAKHAAERNRHIAKLRADMPDGGSGMATDEADAILTAAGQAGLDEALDRHAQTLWDWIDGTRDVLEQGGLITPEQRRSWDDSFRYYVPLRGREGMTEKRASSKGFNLKGKDAIRAMGRQSKAQQIIEQIIQDRVRAYTRAGKNEVLRSFLAFVLDNPSPNLWQVDAVETRPVIRRDSEGDEVVELADRIVTSNTITIMDGGQSVRVLVKDEALLNQFKAVNEGEVGRVIGALLWANRKVGAMLTTYNPVFTVMNGLRDYQAATVGMVRELGFGGAFGLAAEYRAAITAAMRAELGGKASPEYQLFKALGGTTGYAPMGDLKATENELKELMRQAKSRNLPLKAARKALELVESTNTAIENATRFAAFQAARKRGKTEAEATSLAKNITVNFNRKGTKTPWLSAFVLFLNPAIQDTARIARNLSDPKVQALIGTAMVGVFMLALMNADMGGDDDDGIAFWDKVPKDVKERNIVIMSPFGPTRNDAGQLEANYIKLPMPYGYNALKVLAEQIADQYRRSADPAAGRSPAESVAHVATALLNSIQPANAIGQSVEDGSNLVLAPFSNALGPIAQGLANKSGFGSPLHPENAQTRDLPDSSKVFAGQAGTVFDRTAKALNTATGGSKYEKGLIDVSPGALENAVRFYGGGIASFSLDLANAFYARQHLEREEMDAGRLPFARQLLGRINAETDRIGYDLLKKGEEATQPMEAARKAGDAEAIDAIEQRHGGMAWAGTQVRHVRQRLGELRRRELEVIESDATDREKLAELKDIREQVRLALQNWNTSYVELVRERAAANDARKAGT
ncbi:LPD38 domain-containing protein [Roseateles sp. BYS87W]|uniref:LPD38 domain-containing protein n=1 Tax=Pelomonas baiyunensis TaxID=3299026 RepID=A0ABW7GZV7_9BURK